MTWPVVELQAVCQTGSGTTPSRERSDYYGGSIPWVKSGELRETEILRSEEHVTTAAMNETSLKLVPPGALLVAMYGATVGRVGLLGIEATTNQAICHVIPDRSKVDIRYMFHLLQSRASELVARGVGGAQPNISQATVKQLKIPLPPLEEQKRIAAILDQADALRRLRRRALDRLNTLGQAIFHEMFGISGSDFQNPDVPTVEDALSSGALVKIQDGNHGERHPKVQDFQPNGTPFIMANCMREGKLLLDNAYHLPDHWLTYLRKGFAQAGDVLLSHKGTLGQTAVVPNSQRCLILSPQVTFYRCGEGLSPHYLQYYFRTPSFQATLAKNGDQSTRAYIGLTRQRELPLIVPSFDQQVAFVSRMSEVDRKFASYRTAVCSAENLFTSLQHRAFQGAL